MRVSPVVFKAMLGDVGKNGAGGSAGGLRHGVTFRPERQASLLWTQLATHR